MRRAGACSSPWDHWDALASDLASQLAAKLPAGAQLNVDFPSDDSEFGQGLRTVLLTRLTQDGVTPTTESTPFKREIKTQVAGRFRPRMTTR